MDIRNEIILNYLKDLIESEQDNKKVERLLIGIELAYLSGQRDPDSIINKSFILSGIPKSSRSESILINIINKLLDNGDMTPDVIYNLRILTRALKLEQDEIHDVEPVITLPWYIRNNLPSTISIRMKDTSQAIREIIENARNELLIISAFAQKGGIEYIARRLAIATSHGVKIKMITQPPSDNYNPENAIKKLNAIIKREGNIDNLFIYYLNINDGGLLHAKVYIADNQIVYIGSANLTGHAILQNLEAGVLIKGEESRQFAVLFEYIIEKYCTHISESVI